MSYTTTGSTRENRRDRGREGADLGSLIKVQPVLLEVFDDGMAETGVVLVVENGEVLQQVSDDNVEQEDGDEDVVRDEPHHGSHHVTTVAIQLRTIVASNLRMESKRNSTDWYTPHYRTPEGI